VIINIFHPLRYFDNDDPVTQLKKRIVDGVEIEVAETRKFEDVQQPDPSTHLMMLDFSTGKIAVREENGPVVKDIADYNTVFGYDYGTAVAEEIIKPVVYGSMHQLYPDLKDPGLQLDKTLKNMLRYGLLHKEDLESTIQILVNHFADMTTDKVRADRLIADIKAPFGNRPPSNQDLSYILCCVFLTRGIKGLQDNPYNNESIARLCGINLRAFNHAEIALMKFDGLIDDARAAAPAATPAPAPVATTSLNTTSYTAAGSRGSSVAGRDRQTVSKESVDNDVNIPTDKKPTNTK
jgi:hypothetical protein